MSFVLFLSVQYLIFNSEDPLKNSKRYIPIYMFFVGYIIAMVTILKGLKHVFKDADISLNHFHSMGIAALVGTLVAIIGISMLRRATFEESENHQN
jgi:PiT family inorganic phosphate transporter